MQEEARRLGREGVDYLDAGRAARDPDKLLAARTTLRAALALWQKVDDLQGQAAVTGKLGETERALGNPADAISLHLTSADLWTRFRAYDIALRQYELANQIIDATGDLRGACQLLSGRGAAKLASGDHRTAFEDLRAAPEFCRSVGDRKTEVRALSAFADWYTRQGRYDDALAALASAARVDVQDDASSMLVRKNLGILHARVGRFEDARAELEKARAFAIRVKDGETEGVIVGALGRISFELGNYAEARTYYHLALDLLGKSEAPINTDVARGLRPIFAGVVNQIGELELAVGNYQSGRKHFETALRAIFVDSRERVVLRASTDRRMVGIEGAARYNLATAFLALDDPQRALDQLQSVLTVAQDLADQALEGRVLSQQGLALHALRQPEAAGTILERALDIQSRIGDVVGEIETLNHAAAVDRDRQRIPEAIAKLRRAADLLEDVRGSLETTGNRMGFLKGRVAVAERMTGLLAGIANSRDAPPFTLTEAGDDYVSAALHYAERSRSRAWVDQLGRSRGAALALPRDLEREERSLVARRNSSLRAYRELTADTSRARDAYRAASTALRELVARWRADARPEVRAYAALRYPQPVRASEIQTALEPDEVLIEYAIQPTYAVMWIVERERRVRLVPIALSSADIAEAVKDIRATFQYEFEVSEDRLERLHRALLEPALKEAAPGKRLIIVPDGPLFSLPFEALGTRSAAGWRYVSDDRVISYYPSATLLVLTRINARPGAPRTSTSWSHPLLGMGDPLYAADRGFQRLEATRGEVLAIGRVFGLNPASGDLKFGADARESAIKTASSRNALAGYRYVHLATHGLLSAADPRVGEPALVLADEPDGTDDGFLTMGEVLGLRLTSDLVVLSACQTALGDNVPGEGVVGLMRAFFHAGTQSAAVSLWRVSDASTANLMRQFYAGLVSPPPGCTRSDKACALNEARKRLRETHAHPYYWAAFVLFGER